MEKLFHEHMNIISLVTVKMLFIFLLVKLATIFNLGQTHDFRQRIAKQKLDVKNPHNSSCRICSEHLRGCNQAKPYFQIFPFYYETNTALSEYKEKRHFPRWKPLLNLNKTSMIMKLI